MCLGVLQRFVFVTLCNKMTSWNLLAFIRVQLVALMLQVLIRAICARVLFLCEVVIIAICLLVATDDCLPDVFTSTISSIATWHLMYTVCQIGLDNGGYFQFIPFAVVGSVVLLSFFGLIMGYVNIPLMAYLLLNFLSILGLPHSAVCWVNWVTCRLVMFVSCGICVSTLYAALSSLLISLGFHALGTLVVRLLRAECHCVNRNDVR
jgi:hypothetical protein